MKPRMKLRIKASKPHKLLHNRLRIAEQNPKIRKRKRNRRRKKMLPNRKRKRRKLRSQWMRRLPQQLPSQRNNRNNKLVVNKRIIGPIWLRR